MRKTGTALLLLLSLTFISSGVLKAQVDGSEQEDISSLELIVTWKEGFSDTEKDRIISGYGGKLKRRFTIINADYVIFASDANVVGLKEHSSTKCLEENKPLGNSIPKSSNNASFSSPFSPGFLPPDPYVKNNPHPSWRFINRIHEASEIGKQKKEVLVAIVDDGIDIDHPSLSGLTWCNEVEKTGKEGIDDDGNGWVDDIVGISPIDAVISGYKSSGTLYSALAVLGAADYSFSRLCSPKGKVKVVPISSYYWENNSKSNHEYAWHTTTAVILESFDYAKIIGADIIIIKGFVGNSESIASAAKNFDGLIVTGPDLVAGGTVQRLTIITNSNLENVINVGAHSTSFDYMRGFGGPIHISALAEMELLYGRTSSHNFEISSSFLAGVAANIMSCNPQLDLADIKNIILGSSDQKEHLINLSDTSGVLNATRANLGRSSGGVLYISNWARINENGPSVRDHASYGYDETSGQLYVFGGYSPEDDKLLDDFWVWDGLSWKEIKQTKNEGSYPGFRQSGFSFVDPKNGFFVLLDYYANVWKWDGLHWTMEPSHYKLSDNVDSIVGGIYDPERETIIIFCKWRNPPYDVRLWEYNGQDWEWKQNIKIPDNLIALTYNSKSKSVIVAGDPSRKEVTSKLWQYRPDKKWKKFPINDLPNRPFALHYDSNKNEYLALGSHENIWTIRNKTVEFLGYQLPFHYKSFWDSRSCKLLTIGPNSLIENTKNRKLVIRQYSGSIKPTWIDNMILNQSDYTGNGKADLSLWHPATGEFTIKGGKGTNLGKWGDTPVPGDYNGDGKVDFAVVQRTKGKSKWIFEDKVIHFGQFDDIPVPLDYDNDGKTDIAVFRKDTAKWYFKGQKKAVAFGNPADLPIPADYNGDGRPELATYTPVTSTWHIQGLGDFQFGKPGDSPVPADYDGDGRIDIATWNPRKRLWLVMEWGSGKNLIKERFGSKWDIPVPGDYNGDGKAQLATYTPMKALWNIKGQPMVKFGSPGDVPLVRGN